MTVKEQIQAVLRSRKFWALLLSIAGTAVAYSYGKIDAQTAILAGIGAAGAYMVGTGLEGPATPPAPPAPAAVDSARLARIADTDRRAG